jgi:N-acetylglucosamine kinase-like BadF-type ATPase
MKVALGIDAGGSSTRWLLLGTSGTASAPLELASGRTGGITGHLFEAAAQPDPAVPAAPARLTTEGRTSLQRLDELLAAALQAAKPDAAMLGAAGLAEGSPAALFFAEAIRSRLGLAAQAVQVADDMYIAYAAVFAPGEGVLVYGGTGSIAYHVRADGSMLRTGGHGYLIDDAGGGFAIGRAALAQVLRWHDELGRPADQPLAREVYALLGRSEWPEIREEIYRLGRSRVAALAPAVGTAARQGDGAASAILQTAGRELARLGRVASERLGGKLPVTLAGGVTNLGAPLLDSFRAGLPGSEVRVSNAEPVLGAARLALELVVRPQQIL